MSRYRASGWCAALVVALAVAGQFVTAAPAAALSNFPLDTWVTDGSVLAIARTSDAIYLGGDFDYVGPNTGPAAALDEVTGKPDLSRAKPDGEIKAIVPDGHGGFYLGGIFTSLGGQPRASLGQVDEYGNVTPWGPRVLANYNQGDRTKVGDVRALAVGSDGDVWVGGVFQSVGGDGIDQGRENLAVIDPVTGELRPWQYESGVDGPVEAIAALDFEVAVGGAFTHIGGF